MSALRYFEMPQSQPAARRGLIDRLCDRLWAWAAARQMAQSMRSLRDADPHILRDIGLDPDFTDRP